MPDYSQLYADPDYQASYQRISKLRPDQLAVLSDHLAASQTMGKTAYRVLADMQARIQAEARQHNLSMADKRLGLGERTFEANLGLSNRTRDWQKGQNAWALGLGVANLPLSMYAGKKQADLYREMTEAERRWRNQIPTTPYVSGPV